MAKTWIQAPPDSTPIEFEEVWHLDGSTHRGTAKRRLEKLFADLVKYELARPCELVEISTMVNICSGAKRTVKTYHMSLNVFNRYISSSQKERGYRTRAKLHQAEEELAQLAAPEPEKLEEAKPKTTNDEISVFMFPVTNQPVRIVDQSGGLWFVRNDVCDALGHKNPSQATATHCKPEGVQNLDTIDTLGRTQLVTIINEANLNRLIMRSNVEHAIQFQDWVCEEVIPSIRKTGEYNVNPITQLGDEELERLAAPEPEKPEEAEPTDTQDATEDLVPAEIPDGDLVAVIKTWIQAPPDSTPIEFEEVWHLDGSTRKNDAKERFLKVKEHLVNYGLAKENEFAEISVNPSAQGGRPTTTWKMSLNVFKHYISSSQKERGYRTRAKLHQAEEELEQLKAAIRKTGGYNVNPVTQLADILDDPAMNSQLMLELTHRVQKLKQENQIQAWDIGVKTETIKIQAETIQELAPKAAAADRLMSVEGSKLIKVCAKELEVPLKAFVHYLLENKWAHRITEKGDLLAQADKLAKGLMVHVPTVIERGGKLIHGTQARITGKGLIKLAKLLNIDLTKLSESKGKLVVKLAGLQIFNHTRTAS